MNLGFYWTENSLARNSLTEKFEPLQPFIFASFAKKLNASHLYDIGANIGFYSLFLTLLPSIRTVFAFEASDETFKTLTSNVELNGLNEKIFCIKKAVSSNAGSIAFQIESPLSGINSVVDTCIHDANLFNKKIVVDCCTIDGFRGVSNSIIAMKIDVEGHEYHVLQGSKKTLIENECIVQVEIYKDKDSVAHNYLLSLGYKMLFKSKSDYYYSNSTKLINPDVVLNVLEDAVSSFIDARQKKWTRKPSPISLSAVIDGRVLSTEITCDQYAFSRDIEYAFYVNMNGMKIHTQWYSNSNVFTYELDSDIVKQAISVTGFAREKNNQDKKISVTIPAMLIE